MLQARSSSRATYQNTSAGANPGAHGAIAPRATLPELCHGTGAVLCTAPLGTEGDMHLPASLSSLFTLLLSKIRGIWSDCQKHRVCNEGLELIGEAHCFTPPDSKPHAPLYTKSNAFTYLQGPEGSRPV